MQKTSYSINIKINKINKIGYVDDLILIKNISKHINSYQ